MKIIRKLTLVTLLIFFISDASAQDSLHKEINPIQLTIIAPLGTNGIDSWNTRNHISLNLFAGYNGGLEGIEVGGFLNILKGAMNGVQIAGFGNNNFGIAKGLEVSGFYNFNVKASEVVELAGFSNINLSNLSGMQASGFSNFTFGTMHGVQLAGFANYTNNVSHALQASGFVNINRSYARGIQLAGFANLNGKDSKSIQAAGFANITSGDVKGIQVSGFLNAASTLRGAQIGVFNYADSIEDGIAIGFLSYVKHGYHTFELGFGETLNATVSFKTGTERFYNIFSLGAGIRNDVLMYGWGYGVGTLIPVNKKIAINADLITYQLYEDKWFDKYPKMLNKLNIQATYSFSYNFKLFAGPALNVLVYDKGNNNGNSVLPKVSYNIYDKTFDHTHVVVYPGFNAGIRF